MMKGPRIYNSLSPEEREIRLKRKQVQKEKQVHRVRRRWIIAIFAVIFIILGVQISTKVKQTQDLNRQVQSSKTTLNKVNKEKKRLALKRSDLKNTDYVAKLIRSKFLYSKPNEKIYNLPEGNNSN